MAFLEITDLHTEIKTRSGALRAVDGVSLAIGQGETLGLVGESGSGKSMVANSIMQLLPPGGSITSGTITLDRTNLVKLGDAGIRRLRGSQIGLIFQDPMSSLNPTMTIGDQIAESVRFHRRVSKAAALDRAREVLELVSMPRAADRLSDYPHQLSGGLRQRVVIAMALACAPRLVIADEPTTALDVTIQAQILELLDDLRSELQTSMLLITHDLGVVAERTDSVAVMYAGRVVESARTEDLFARIRHPYTEALLASIPRLDQDRGQRLYSIPGLPPDLRKPLTGCRFAARCSFASDRCRTEEPPLIELGPGHLAACFHPRGQVEVRPRAGAPIEFGAVSGSAEPATEPKATPAASGALLELRSISKTFPVAAGAFARRNSAIVHAVSDVSLMVAPGETLGLVGESGCGKTTLGRIATTLETPTAGQIFFQGEEIGGLRESQLRRIRRDVQLVFQDPYSSLDPRMRVGAIVREPLVWHREGDKASRQARGAELLDQVGLPRNAADRYPHEFSGGQRQRIAIARALALNPRLIVADEPVSALDVSIRSQVLNLMKELQRQYEVSYVVISHDLSVVRYIADRIAVMYLGRIVEVGTGDEIYASPAHPYTAGLLASIPVPDPALKHTRAAIRGELPSAVDPPSGCRFRLRCPLAQARCAAEVPSLTGLAGTHEVACHFPLSPGETLAEAATRAGKDRSTTGVGNDG